MPELAEVEYYRKRWDAGLRQRIRSVALHGEKRLFRGADTAQLARVLKGATYLGSETRGKQIAFRFSKAGWLGIHLGMTGNLRTESPDFRREKHDHLVLFQAKQALVFKDARMFGRVRFHAGKEPPDWWAEGPPAIHAEDFTLAYLRAALARRRAPIKAVLLDQKLFPGVGNWMADEILWRAGLNPHRLAAELTAAQTRALHGETRFVCRVSLETIGVDWADPPAGWLLHVRWKKTGHCPRDRTPLRRETIGGRTTAWCQKCQKGEHSNRASRVASNERLGPHNIMPEKKTVARASKDKKQGKAASTQAGEFVREEIDKVRAGEHGVRSTKQAIAIGLSKARRAGVKLKAPAKGKAPEATRQQAKRELAKSPRERAEKPDPKRSRAAVKALQRESTKPASKAALSKQTKAAARKRTPADRSASAKKAARTRKANA